MQKFLEFRGKRTYYQYTGNGPVIVLLHGFLESSAMWKNFSRKLSKDYTVITIDLPGHGQSEIIPAAPQRSNDKRQAANGKPFLPFHSMDLMAEAVHHVLKSLKINSCLMVGHSMGGYVTLAFAEKYPRILKGFVLFHSHAAADTPEVLVTRERTIAAVQSDHHGFIKTFIPGLFDPANVRKYSGEIDSLKDLAQKTPKEGIIAAIEGMKTRPDRLHVLANAKIPVLFIIGKNDSRIPMQTIFPQTILPGHSESILLDHIGHMGFIEAHIETYEALKGFAERVF